jgi:effector-binding domain-containing protein
MRFIALMLSVVTFAIQAQPTTQPATAEEFAVTKMRVLTTTEQTYFYKEVETTIAKIGEVAERVIDEMDAAIEKSGNKCEGSVTFVYINATADMNKPFKLQIGVPVQKGGVEFGDFKVRQLASAKAATVLFSGSLQHLHEVYQTLYSSIFSHRHQPTEEMRETYFNWEGADSPNNVLQLQVVLKQ